MSGFRRLPLLASALLAGCTVGPHYAGPPSAAPHAESGAGFVRGQDGRVTAPAPTLARWWTVFGDPTLDELEQRALAGNPDLAAAQARLRQARAQLRLERANATPKINASALYAHARIPGVDLGGDTEAAAATAAGNAEAAEQADTSTLDLYNLGFDASWEFDLFGGQRRAVEAARANAEAAQANADDARVSLTADVADAYLNLRDRQQRLALARQAVVRQEEMLALTRQRFARGTVAEGDLVRLQQQLEGTRADVTPLSAELDSYRDALAILTGAEPGSVDMLVAATGPVPLPPAQVAIGNPAALLRHRPDIRAAERTLAADTAKIGQADAARFPRISIMGLVGLGGSSPSDLTHLDDFTALVAPQLSWSFLDFGRNAARVRQAEATRDEADAKYRSAVLGALRDAEDALSRFAATRGTVATLARASAAAGRAAELATERYRAGTATRIDQLDAERAALAAQQSLVQAKANLSRAFVAVEKSLGLGWSDGAPAEEPALGSAASAAR